MELIYVPEELPTAFSKSIFLAGPTPRGSRRLYGPKRILSPVS